MAHLLIHRPERPLSTINTYWHSCTLWKRVIVELLRQCQSGVLQLDALN